MKRFQAELVMALRLFRQSIVSPIKTIVTPPPLAWPTLFTAFTLLHFMVKAVTWVITGFVKLEWRLLFHESINGYLTALSVNLILVAVATFAAHVVKKPAS